MESIVALDAYGINPGDLSWEEIRSFGSLSVYDHTERSQMVPRANDATVLLVDMLALGDAELSRLPKLRYVGLFATGHDHIDTAAAERRGIAVANVPEYSTPSVAQMTFALLLTLTNRVCSYSAYVSNGKWVRGNEFCYVDSPLIELSGKKLGVLGFGQIGAAVARIAASFGMRVMAWSRRRKDTPGFAVEWAEMDEIFRSCDVVTLHLPLTTETAAIVNRSTLHLMKPSAFLVNTARGGLIKDEDLAEALAAGRIAGAALDVVGSEEPPAPGNPLLQAPNCIVTPHIAWATRAARERCLREAARNLESFLAGESRNRIV